MNKSIDIDKVASFAELLNDPVQFEMVRSRFEHIIWSSFAVIDKALLGKNVKITQEETKRRFEICERWFRIMRGELGFSLVRTLDTLSKALACELLDQPFDPNQNLQQGWYPTDMTDVLPKND